MVDRLVSIAMATYNGAAFLREQLDSIYNQTYKNIEVIVCDDRSSDHTINILIEYQKKYGLNYYINDTQLGVVKNFEKAISKCQGHYVALADQDDVWLPNKIELSLSKLLLLEAEHKNIPILVFTDLHVVDKQLHTLQKSYWEYMKLNPGNTSFNRILVENVITGCTILMNKPLASMALPIPEKALMHDVWIAMIASYFGKIDYLKEATVLYRQHSYNAIGASRLSKYQILKNAYRKLSKLDLRLLKEEIGQAEAFNKKFITLISVNKKNKDILDNFIQLKHSNILYRRYIMLKYNFYANTFIKSLNIFARI